MAGNDGFYPGRAPIDAYGNGGFRFAGMSHRGSLLYLPSGIRRWDTRIFTGLDPYALECILLEADAIDTLLIGTGRNIVPLEQQTRDLLRSRGIGADTMTTGAAARTYNVLLAENRRVAAALIAVE